MEINWTADDGAATSQTPLSSISYKCYIISSHRMENISVLQNHGQKYFECQCFRAGKGSTASARCTCQTYPEKKEKD
jgi:hypothetical protein